MELLAVDSVARLALVQVQVMTLQAMIFALDHHHTLATKFYLALEKEQQVQPVRQACCTR
jgi:hypothetical protein